jgi:hypothetical protein
MGDPTLRMHQVAPAANLAATGNGSTVAVTWSPSVDATAGYHVYRAASADGPFTRLTTSPVTVTNFSDTTSTSSNATYMVRAIKLESTPSGTYYNSSQGVFAKQSTATAPASPRVSLTKTPGGMLVSWTSQLGTIYRVQCKDASGGTNWTEVSGQVTGLATKTTWLDPNSASQSVRLYRVVAQ